MYKLPFISYIPIGEDFEDDNPYLPDRDSKDKKEKEDKKDKEETPIILQPQIVAQIPESVKVTTPAATAVVAETAPSTPSVKVSTPAYIVQNPYTPTKPMVTRSATNSEISIPNFSSVQRTDVPQMNSLQSGKIRIADNVVMYPELESEILEALLRFGISGTVTSAYREGAVAHSGKPSYHASRQAFDFVPRFGNSVKDFTDLYTQLKQSGALDYLNSKGYFILYEDKNINPDSTGPHFHIGKDVSQNSVLKAENGVKLWQDFSSIVPSIGTYGSVDEQELKKRQAWAESNNNPYAVSPAGAMGTYQIMPSVKEEYVKRTGHKGSLTDPAYNERVRDWYFNERIPEHYFVNAGNPTEEIKAAKQLAAYNYGPKNTMNRLLEAKKSGIDIYTSFD
jgi:hypothetical protein